MQDKFDVFGSIPDTIEDDWIEEIKEVEAKMDEYIHLRQKTRNVFELRYKENMSGVADVSQYNQLSLRAGKILIGITLGLTPRSKTDIMQTIPCRETHCRNRAKPLQTARYGLLAQPETNRKVHL